MILFAVTAMATTPTERPADTWNLDAVYPSVAAWEADIEKTQGAITALAACKGTLATQLRPCLEKRFEAKKAYYRAWTYAANHSSADTRDATWQARAAKVELLEVAFSEATSFFEPEILALGAEKVEAAIKADAGLAPYDYYLRSTVKNAPHTLDAKSEALLAATGTVFAASGNTRNLLFNAELPWPEAELSSGKVSLTPAGYTNARAAANRDDRKKVFDTFFGALQKYEATFGSTLNGVVQGHWIQAKARNYPTSVAAAIDADHLPPEVYQALVKQTNANLPTLHRYLKLRAKMLGISDLAYYDLYPPLVAQDKQFGIDEAKSLTLAACKPLGTAYTDPMKTAFEDRWMDVYPRPGKTAGAYMDGAAYEVHPYLLLNYTGDYESVSTFAHEWGHAMHSVLSARKQPFAKADYATFIAEIASTFNEALLLQAMLDQARSDDEKLFYLGTALEGLRTTYFRQALFGEFELAIHDKVEKGDALTGADVSKTYLEIARRYYGHDQGVTRVDEAYGVEWAYVGHFYYNFYVWQYATSIAASSLLADDVMAKKPGALDRYLGLLQAGGSDDPYVLLKNAGVDMATAAPYDSLARRMDRIMDQMEAILAKKEKATKKGKK